MWSRNAIITAINEYNMAVRTRRAFPMTDLMGQVNAYNRENPGSQITPPNQRGGGGVTNMPGGMGRGTPMPGAGSPPVITGPRPIPGVGSIGPGTNPNMNPDTYIPPDWCRKCADATVQLYGWDRGWNFSKSGSIWSYPADSHGPARPGRSGATLSAGIGPSRDA